MSIKIYYFSGTGNSLALAKGLKSALNENAELIRMSDYKSKEIDESDVAVIGFVFPVYFGSIPAIVMDFIERISIKGNPYIFAVAACNAVPGHSLFTLDKLLKKKGYQLSAGYKVDMPGVSVVDGFLTSQEVNLERIINSKIKILDIVNVINEKVYKVPEGDDSIKTHLKSRLITFAASKMLNPKLFYTTNKCNGCSTCQKVCPVENIKMSPERKPLWGKECQHCLACLHLCPQGAVELGKHSQGKARFKHPDVELMEML
jgi:ferredoxin/flavodoxin